MNKHVRIWCNSINVLFCVILIMSIFIGLGSLAIVLVGPPANMTYTDIYPLGKPALIICVVNIPICIFVANTAELYSKKEDEE